jgi:hypothetical protein
VSVYRGLCVVEKCQIFLQGVKRSEGTDVDLSAARRLLQDLFVCEADIIPDYQNHILLVRVHNASRPAANRSLARLFEQLNQTETIYPDTNLRLVYELNGSGNPDP